ncbi:MAG: transglycosylase family protein, partial [Acidimicrobiales bacterium]
LRAAATARRSTLAAAVVQSYTGAGMVAPVLSAALAPLVSSEYLAIASGDVSDHLDAYRLSERRLVGAIAVVRREEATARADVAQAAVDRRAALGDAFAEERQLVVLEARMAAAPKAPTVQGGPVAGGLVAVVKAQTSSPPATTAAPPASPLPATTTTSPPPTTGSGTTTSGTTTTSPPATSPPATSPPTTGPPTTGPPTTGPPTTTPPTAPAATAAGVWLQLRECESGDNYRENTGNGYYGAYQFSEQTWTGLGYPGRPDLEPPAMQDAAAQKLQAESGWGPWPACAAELGLL